MEKNIIHLKTLSDLGHLIGWEIQHPLVGVLDFSKLGNHPMGNMRILCDFYVVMYKRNCYDRLRWGCQPYDFQEGSLVCISPKHVIDFESSAESKGQAEGWALFFHPDFILGSSLGGMMKDYSFFSYQLSEALHLSERECSVLADSICKIQVELFDNMDEYSQSLILSNIEVLLNYCRRYYGRQFITRKPYSRKLLEEAETFMQSYFLHQHDGWQKFPTVSILADYLHLSPNYLSDLLKKELGMSAKDFIHYHLIEEAKHRLLCSDRTINEISFDLGFEYPQYFTRLFKSKTGLTPLAYRNAN